jgi:hypothetical protein
MHSNYGTLYLLDTAAKFDTVNMFVIININSFINDSTALCWALASSSVS